MKSVSQCNSKDMVKWLNQRKVRSFYTTGLKASSLSEGARHLLQVTNTSKLSRPDHCANHFLRKLLHSVVISVRHYCTLKWFLCIAQIITPHVFMHKALVI